MKPPRFGYHDPTTVEEALGLLTRHGDAAKILAGGQSLMPMLNFRLVRPGHVIDINRVSRARRPWPRPGRRTAARRPRPPARAGALRADSRARAR